MEEKFCKYVYICLEIEKKGNTFEILLKKKIITQTEVSSLVLWKLE